MKHPFTLLSGCLLILGFAQQLVAGPANDAFASPTLISGLPATATGTNWDATSETNEPKPFYNEAGASVWFEWTPANTAIVQMDTIGSDFDTALAVWTGTDLASLSEEESDHSYNGNSSVFVNVTAGVRYRIAVYGWKENTGTAARGNITLNIQNDPRSTITGTVTDQDGVTPLDYIDVNVYRADGNGGWNYVKYTYTQSDGSYSLAGLLPGTYRVGFKDYNFGTHADEYYNNAANLASATDIVVGTAVTVSGINASLGLQGAITGTVTGPDGVTPLEDIQIRAYVWDEDYGWDWVGDSAYTQADGTYNLDGLSANTYRLRFYDYYGSGYLTEYYNNASNVETAADVVVAASATVTGINASLGHGSTITGTVTAQNGGAPLSDISVYAYLSDGSGGWNQAGSAYTELDGTYSLGGLAPGTYRVGFEDNYSYDYAGEYHNNAADLASATDIVVGTAATVSGINGSLAERSRITGKVTGPDGVTPLEDIQVRAYVWDEDYGWDWVGNSVYTQADGTYSLGGLNANTYRLRFYDYSGSGYLTEYYNNVSNVASATDVVVAASATVNGINASLALGSSITGTVTAQNGGAPLSSIYVNAYRQDGSGGWQQISSAYTQANGTYSIEDLPAGTYRVEFIDYNSGNYASEYYNNAATIDSATNVVVGTAATVGGINAALADLGRITGKVTASDGITPLSGITVTAYYWDGYDEYWSYFKSTSTQTDGTYSITGLNAESYRLQFSDNNDVYLTEYYNNATTIDSAASIVVGASATVSGINASLVQESRITGTVTGPDGVTPLSSIEVSVYRANGSGGWEWAGYAYSQTNGSYSVEGLVAGTYRVEFDDDNYGIHVDEYYNNAADLASATNIVVGTAATVGGINASLAELGRITGKVTGSDGVAALEDIRVTAYYWDGDEWESFNSTYTQADGTYNLGGLTANSYRLRFQDGNNSYAEEYYNNAPNVGSASSIVVATSATVSGINASLSRGSRITGTVTAPDGVTPLEDIEVAVYSPDGSGGWESVRYTYSQADGSYSVGGLAAGTYRVGFFDYDYDNYATEYYDNKATIAAAMDIVVGGASVVDGIDASLAELGRIAGTVTGPDGVTPLEDIRVRTYKWDAGDQEWYSVRSAYTASNGSYTIRGLEAGTYRVGFFDEDYETYLTEYYNNATDVAAASDIAVALSATVGGINASLTEASLITGKVTGPDGVTPLEDIRVRAYEWDAGDQEWYSVSSAYTGSDGSYTLRGLKPGTYRVGFFDEDYEIYLTEYYNNAADVAAASNIAVALSATVGGINASLTEASLITGKVTGPDGVTPLEDVQVSAYGPDGAGSWKPLKYAYTRSNGTYTIVGLVPGTYRVRFFDGGDYAEEFYNNATSLASAANIVVGVSVTVAGIDASLADASFISGTVTGPDGVTPLDDIYVSIYRQGVSGSWEHMRTRYSSSNGSYMFGGLAAGTYRIGFSDQDYEIYADEYYDNAANVASAANIVVGASATVSGINASMSTTPPVAAPEIAVEYPSGAGLVDNGAARNMGTVTVGLTGTVTTLRIRNLGGQNLTGIAVSASGAHAGDIVLGLPTVTVLAPGAHADFTVAFKPKAGGARSATLKIVSNDADENPFDIPLVGTGAVPPAPEIAVSQGAELVDNKSIVDFKTAKVKKSVVVKTFTIRNLGKAPLSGLKISTKGGQNSDFVPSKLKSASLAPGASATFKVTFKPTAKGNRSTVLLVSSNDADEKTFEIRLKGKGKVIAASSPAGALGAATAKEAPRKPLLGEDLIDGLKYRTLTVFKSSPGGTVAGTVEVSSNLVDWFSGRNHTTVVENNETYCKVRDNMPVSKGLKRFIRLKAATN